MTEMNKKTIRQLLMLVTFAILLYSGLEHMEIVLNFLKYIFTLFFPFLLGLAIAFILNVPVTLIENKIFYRKNQKMTEKQKKRIRFLSISLSIIIVLVILIFVMFLIVPEFIKTIQLLIEKLPTLLTEFQNWLTNITTNFPDINQFVTSIKIDQVAFQTTLKTWLETSVSGILNSSINFIISLITGMINFFIAFIFAIYILAQKENLGKQVNQVLTAYCKEKYVKSFFKICSLAHKTFSSFITVQCVEACILGTLCFIGMLIFRFPYALSISVLVAVTALIPVFGAFIAATIGAILIFITNPIQAVWFIVYFLVLQQIEGNIIYPRVIGKSVSLPAMWVMLAVTIGGSLFGIIGMLISVPVSSICYALFREATKNRLKEKEIQVKVKNKNS